MHNKKKIIFFILLVLIAAVAIILWKNQEIAQKNLLVSGSIQTNEIYFGSRQGGRISQVFVQEGTILEKDQLILRLEAPELLEQQKSLKANFRAEQALLEEFEAGYRTEDVKSTEANFKASQAEYKKAKQNLNRQEELYKKDLISKDQLEIFETQEQVSEEKLNAASSQNKKMYTGERSERIKAEKARTESLKAELEGINTKIEELEVRSPCHCRLSEFDLREGSLILPNQTLGTLIDEQDLWIEAYLPEEYYGRVKLHQQVQFTSLSYPDQKFFGEIQFIGLHSEFTPRNIQTIEGRKQQVFKIKVKPSEKDMHNKLFFPGMDMDLKFEF